MGRGAKLCVVVGQKEIGKSTTTIKFLRDYVRGNVSTGAQGRKVLIFDTQNEYSVFPDIRALAMNQISLFSIHPEISIRRIPPFKLQTGIEMTPDEKAMAVIHILERFRNGLVLLEDINDYIGDHLPMDVVGKILSQRHKGTDMVLHYHSLGRVQKKIWPHINVIRMHKCSDSVVDNRDKFPEKFECFKIAENIVDNQFMSGNNYFHLYIDFVKQKVLCNVSQEEKHEAIRQYLMQFNSKRIKPYLDIRNEHGKKEYTYERAFSSEKERILKAYFPAR